ncbi:MAG: YitT family protein, partial [Clostridia bacterium]|nr:YitT family protein [Clostridia bacterium]
VGTSVALAFKIGGSTGGTDITAVMIQKKINANSIAWTIFGLNCVIIGTSLFVFKPTYYADGTIDLGMTLLPIMMAAFETYIESKTNESILNGFQSAREFRIITDKPEEMAQALMRELSRGVSALPATGMYTKDSHTMLVCVVNRRQVATLRRIIKKVDPDSFAVMSNVSQVLGLGFYTDQL